MSVEGSVSLGYGFTAEGKVNLNCATIGGNLICDGGQITNRSGDALRADTIRVEGGLFLRNGFKVEGDVHLVCANIGGDLDCSSASFRNPGATALCADRVTVTGGIFLHRDFRAEGRVHLSCAEIGGDLTCSGGHIVSEGIALLAQRMRVQGNVFLDSGFKARGQVSLCGSRIGGNLSCSGGSFFAQGTALNADEIKVGSGVFLSDGFMAEGEVRLHIARIGGNFTCVGGQLVNPGGAALSADQLKVEGSVFLEKFKAEGEVRLHSATIVGNLYCRKAQLTNRGGRALSGDGLEIEGAVFLNDNFRAHGEVRLPGATIGNDLDCRKGYFLNRDALALVADGMKVKGSVYMSDGFTATGTVSLFSATIDGYFMWTDVASPAKVSLLLVSTRIGTLWDEHKSWPRHGNLYLHGLVYDEIHDRAPSDPESRIAWLRRQPGGHYWPQPYEQLAAVLRKRGHTADASRILVAKERERRKQLGFFGRVLHCVLGLTIGYGYRSWLALLWMLGFIALGWGLFEAGYSTGLITPSQVETYSDGKAISLVVSEDYPALQSLIYSLDMFVPLINLHQADYWLPNVYKGRVIYSAKTFTIRTGRLLLGYMWIHIISGWTLTTLLVASLTGLVRK